MILIPENVGDAEQLHLWCEAFQRAGGDLGHGQASHL